MLWYQGPEGQFGVFGVVAVRKAERTVLEL
jgi:hypothetical protein